MALKQLYWLIGSDGLAAVLVPSVSMHDKGIMSIFNSASWYPMSRTAVRLEAISHHKQRQTG